VSTTVSIVVPAYNNADYIERTMDSILAQTHSDLEIIVADHSSTDGTWDVLQKYRTDHRVTLIRTEAGGGALANWNRVSQAATGTYIKLVCGDDLIYPEMVAAQFDALEANPHAVLAASARDIIDANDAPVVHQAGNVAGVKSCNGSRFEIAKGGAKVLTLAQNDEPRQAGLEPVQRELFEQLAVIGDGPAPFQVVITPVKVIRI
jgi:glycosyltransferase involved in cell wall biosynthesis